MATTCTPRPFQGSLNQPRTDARMIAAVYHAKDLTGIEVKDGAHPGLESLPRVSLWVFEVAHGTEAVLIDTQHCWPETIDVRQQECRGSAGSDVPSGAWPPHHSWGTLVAARSQQ